MPVHADSELLQQYGHLITEFSESEITLLQPIPSVQLYVNIIF
jgi:hypothetical protein